LLGEEVFCPQPTMRLKTKHLKNYYAIN